MKTTRLALFIISLLPLMVACGGNSVTDIATNNKTPQILLDDSKLQFVSIQDIGGTEESGNFLEANITPPMADSGDNTDPRLATISPDGEKIVALRMNRETNIDSICVYRFSSNATTCIEVGEQFPRFTGGFWSPDSRYVVLNTDVEALIYMHECDLLIYDTQENRLINRTDDGVPITERIIDEGFREKTWVDLTPIFAPNGDLYFFRNAIDPSVDEWRADLMRIPANEITGTSTPEVILRHPSDVPFPTFRTSGWQLDGSMSISPNGQYLAYSAITQDADDPNNGIWVIDLTQKSVKVHIPTARFGIITTGMPPWWVEKMAEIEMKGIFANSLSWASDSNRLVIMLVSGVYTRDDVLIPPLKYDVSANTLESFYDYTTISEEFDERTTIFDSQSINVDNVPLISIMSPTDKTLFYIGRNTVTNKFVLSAMAIPESGFTTPRRIEDEVDFVPLSVERVATSIGYNGKTIRILSGLNLITLTEQ